MRMPEHGFCRYMGVLGLSVRWSLASVFLDLPLDCPLINRKGKGLMIKERVPEGGARGGWGSTDASVKITMVYPQMTRSHTGLQ